MDKNGQLTFADDPFLRGSNEVYQLIEEGDFRRAVKLLDELLGQDPEYPGLADAYRTARFWQNRLAGMASLQEGRETADFLMLEWEVYDDYARTRDMADSPAYRAAMRHVFFRASEHYKKAFQNQEDAAANFELLLNLGMCFLRLEEYRYAIDTLEYARSTYNANARLLFILAESYYHVDDVPRSLGFFREAFLVDPQAVDMSLVRTPPILELARLAGTEQPDSRDAREWIPVYGFLTDTFYVKSRLSRHYVEGLRREIYNLEVNYQAMTSDERRVSGVLPRLITKYLWLLDYYEFQNYNFENLQQIRDRLLAIDKDLFREYFARGDRR